MLNIFHVPSFQEHDDDFLLIFRCFFFWSVNQFAIFCSFSVYLGFIFLFYKMSLFVKVLRIVASAIDALWNPHSPATTAGLGFWCWCSIVTHIKLLTCHSFGSAVPDNVNVHLCQHNMNNSHLNMGDTYLTGINIFLLTKSMYFLKTYFIKTCKHS